MREALLWETEDRAGKESLSDCVVWGVQGVKARHPSAPWSCLLQRGFSPSSGGLSV